MKVIVRFVFDFIRFYVVYRINLLKLKFYIPNLTMYLLLQVHDNYSPDN